MYAMSVSWLTWQEAKSQVYWSTDMDVDIHSVGEVVEGNATSEATSRIEVVPEMMTLLL